MAGTTEMRSQAKAGGVFGATSAGSLPVSVVIPCYRCAETIARAMGSVADQTRLPAEVILVDDASPDEGRTLTAIDELVERHQSRFKVVTVRLTRNQGPASARNAGLEASSQPHVAFLDADDAWHRKKLEIQHEWMVANDVDISGHDTLILDSIDDFPGLPETWQAERINRFLMLASNRLPMRSVMVRASLGLRFEDGLYYAEDYAAWLKLAWTGHQLWRLPLPLACTFKSEYGAGGLTAQLWPMHRGELHAFRTLHRAGRIPAWLWAASVSLLWIRLFRRWLLS